MERTVDEMDAGVIHGVTLINRRILVTQPMS